MLEPGGGEPGGEPLPDLREVDGVLYSSRPVAVYGDGGRIAIERLREIVAADGRREASGDVVWLDRVDAMTLLAEGEDAGLRALPSRARARDGRVRGLDGGDARWLTARCASARSIPT